LAYVGRDVSLPFSDMVLWVWVSLLSVIEKFSSKSRMYDSTHLNLIFLPGIFPMLNISWGFGVSVYMFCCSWMPS
jgi:hypothetical protein